MAAFGTKVVVLMMVLPSLVLLLQQTSSVEAVDILFFNETSCDGTATGGCYDIEADSCCSFPDAAAVGINNLLDGEAAAVYSGDNCATEITSLNGPFNSSCYYGSPFSGAGYNSTL